MDEFEKSGLSAKKLALLTQLVLVRGLDITEEAGWMSSGKSILGFHFGGRHISSRIYD